MQDPTLDEDGVCAIVAGIVNCISALIGGRVNSDGVIALASDSDKQQEEIERG